MLEKEKLGEFAYMEYGNSVGNKNYRGEEMPKWEELPKKIMVAWVHVAAKIKEKMLEI